MLLASPSNSGESDGVRRITERIAWTFSNVSARDAEAADSWRLVSASSSWNAATTSGLAPFNEPPPRGFTRKLCCSPKSETIPLMRLPI